MAAAEQLGAKLEEGAEAEGEQQHPQGRQEGDAAPTGCRIHRNEE
jgi:hypothetical protein